MGWDPNSKEAQEMIRKSNERNSRMMRRLRLREKYKAQGKDFRAVLDANADPRIKSLKKQIVSEYQKQHKGISKKQAESDAISKSRFGRSFSYMFYEYDDPTDEIIDKINRKRVRFGKAPYKISGRTSSGHSGGVIKIGEGITTI